MIWSFAARSLSNGYKMNKKKELSYKKKFKDLKLTAKAKFSRSANSRKLLSCFTKFRGRF
jgi:hypothetical protein